MERCVTPLNPHRQRLTSGRTEQPGNLMTSLFQALMIILNVVWFIMIAHIIMSWLLNFQVLNIRQPMVAQIWYGLTRLLEPIYTPIRRILPQTPGLDLAPLVAFVALIILQRVLINNAGFFYGY
jgi:YggT family protein